MLNYKKMVEEVDNLIKELRNLKREENKRAKLSERASNMELSANRRSSIIADLNVQSIHVHRLKTNVSRLFHDSKINVGTEEKEANPTGFHKYRY